MPYYPVDIDGILQALDSYKKLYANTLEKDYCGFGYDEIATLKYQTYLLQQIQILETFISNEENR